MQFHLAQLTAMAAAAAGLYAAQAKSLIPLRAAAAAACLFAIAYGILQGNLAAVALSITLFAMNGWRLYEMAKLMRGISAASKSDMNVDWLLPYTRPKNFRAGQTIMKRGDYATQAFYVVAGEIEVVELGQSFGKGTLIGEIGLFAPDGRRTMSVCCKTDVEAAVLDYDRFKELCFDNPDFGFRLLHLVVARLLVEREPTRPAVLT